MKLEFKLLIVDDEPDNIKSAIGLLSDHLESKGFTLDDSIATDLSEKGLEKLARTEGKNYDLVMVDYGLGRPDIDGAKAAHRFRTNLPYTDMVFYSSISERELLGKLAEQNVSGVFVARREELDVALNGIANTVIGKAVDLNHMRGIAMAEVAEMDLLMEETLKRAFNNLDDKCIDRASRKTIQRLREGIKKDLESIEHLDHNGILKLVSDSRLFTSIKKYWAIKRVAKCLSEPLNEELKILGSYQKDVISNRNMLAHVKENSTEDGKIILSSRIGGRDIVIDDDWMTDFRRKLRMHRDALSTVCESIEDSFGNTVMMRDT